MGMLEKIGQWVEEKVDPAEHRLEVTNKAQIELMMAFGEDKSGVWIDAYSRRFRELIGICSIKHFKHTMTQSKK